MTLVELTGVVDALCATAEEVGSEVLADELSDRIIAIVKAEAA